ncbi:MAG: ferritin-like domain-containing protein [Lutisporaceae bacterium]
MSPDMYMQNPEGSKNIRKLLDLIKEAMRDERHDYKKYRMMQDMTDNRDIKENLRFAYEDEGKHYRMFQSIYEDLTREEIEIPTPKVELEPRFIDNIKTSINGELAAVEMYRGIRAMLCSKKHRDMLYEIITDEQEHATRFVWSYAILK